MKQLPIVASHLKRFEHSSIQDKISHKRNGNNNSALAALQKNGEESTTYSDNKYSLFAVINHEASLDTGHYTAFIRQQRDQWFKCDDHLITRARLKDVLTSEG